MVRLSDRSGLVQIGDVGKTNMGAMDMTIKYGGTGRFGNDQATI
jgi:hypothetical protein